MTDYPIDRKRLVATFTELVQIDSPTLSEKAAASHIKALLAPLAAEITEDDAARRTGSDSDNIFIRIAGNTPGRPVIMLNAHMDVVQPCTGIKPIVDEKYVRSDGSTVLGADDKAGIAAIIETVRVLRESGIPHGDLLLLFTIAEEIGLEGAQAIDPALLKADLGITVDCSGGPGAIYCAAPFHDRLTTVISGRASHAGMEPEKGINAIAIASKAIASMTLGRIDHETTCNIGVISGGRAINIVPESVTVDGEARSHSEDKVNAQIAAFKNTFSTAAAEAGASVEFRYKREYPGYCFPPGNPFLSTLSDIAADLGYTPRITKAGGGSDANIFNHLGIPTIPIGAGYYDCHSTGEYLVIDELAGIVKFLLRLIEKNATGN